MTTTQCMKILGLAAALPLAGCYSGLSGNGGDGRGDGFGDGADDAADDGADDGANDDANEEPPRADGDDDGGGPEEPPFMLPVEEVMMTPFPVRMANLSAVASVPLDHPMFFKAYDLRLLLGDHDYSQVLAPNLRWSVDAMQNWVKAVKPVCASNEIHVKYPNLLTDPGSLVRDAYGRDPAPEDLEPLLDIAGSTMDTESKYQLTCIAVLSSLEFVAY